MSRLKPLPPGRRAILTLLVFFGLAAAASAGDSHVLQQGETLFRVSRKYDVPVEVLQRFNRITAPQALKVGTRIAIPDSYSVRAGDTLYGIARRYSVDLAALLGLNGINESEVLKVGRVLYLPAGSTATAGDRGPGGSQTAGPSPGRNAQQGGAAGGDLLAWPLSGTREPLKGRILGTIIHGQTGQTVVSVSSGRVIWAGPYRGFSRVVLIEGDNGYTYVYAGNEETLVRVGDTVRQGSEIGRLGKNVHQGTAQLYFLVYRNGTPVDPSQAPRG
ncbi:MAG: LysM peptidoglycan-binding domain-containing protein [Spirochaetales bacterium]|nr:LysM peptidoglycan-binding domain-containing protein [Spirochaetales bacterium]